MIATRNRRETLLRTLDDVAGLPERPDVIVVDNGSTDGTAAAARSRLPSATVIELDVNRGAAARSIGVRAARTPYVAFADDDSGWSAGSLERAARLLERHPRLALVAARILVGDDKREDPTSTTMAISPLSGSADVPGVPVLGFVACGAVVRRTAFLAVGGFSERLWFEGEEALLALDLASAGWALSYVADIVAWHTPSAQRDRHARAMLHARNAVWVAWLRRPVLSAVRETLRLTSRAIRDPAARKGVAAALFGLGGVLRERRPVTAELESAIRALERGRFAPRSRLGGNRYDLRAASVPTSE